MRVGLVNSIICAVNEIVVIAWQTYRPASNITYGCLCQFWNNQKRIKAHDKTIVIFVKIKFVNSRSRQKKTDCSYVNMDVFFQEKLLYLCGIETT